MTGDGKAVSGSLAVAAVGPVLGGEARGVDVESDLDDALVAAIKEALLAYKVLVFRDQHISEATQVALSRPFGELQRHVLNQYQDTRNPEVMLVSNLDAEGRPKGEHPDPGACIWHTDGSWQARPGHMTMLFGIEVPRSGVETWYADTQAAYDALDDETRALIEDLSAVHDLDASRRRTGARDQMTEEQKRQAPPVAQRIVRVHPETGRKALYLGEHASHVPGMDFDEGRALVDRLNRHAAQDRFVYRHRWVTGDLVMWDNRSVMHRAMPYDTANERRVIRRTTTLGETTGTPLSRSAA